MKKAFKLYIFLSLNFLLVIGCKEVYQPPSVAENPDILVIEGFINVGGDTSYFSLSRSVKLGATSSPKAETNAQITVLNENGTQVAKSLERPNGKYLIYGTVPSGNHQYQVKINTKNGKQYISELVVAKQTPAIDSISWNYDEARNGIQFYANTHDATNNTRYYRWEYEETWESRSYIQSYLDYVNNQIVPRAPEKNIYQCYPTAKSDRIILGSSTRLSQDIISGEPVALKVKGDSRFNVRYSLLLKQYALTKEAYAYWQNLQKVSESGGNIFDVQPTETIGNYKNVSDPLDPVIGFLSANTVQEKRIFITRDDVPSSFITRYPFACESGIAVNPHPDSLKLYFGSKGLIPIDIAPPFDILAFPPECADCRVIGGTNVKPTFW